MALEGGVSMLILNKVMRLLMSIHILLLIPIVVAQSVDIEKEIELDVFAINDSLFILNSVDTQKLTCSDVNKSIIVKVDIPITTKDCRKLDKNFDNNLDDLEESILDEIGKVKKKLNEKVKVENPIMCNLEDVKEEIREVKSKVDTSLTYLDEVKLHTINKQITEVKDEEKMKENLPFLFGFYVVGSLIIISILVWFLYKKE